MSPALEAAVYTAEAELNDALATLSPAAQDAALEGLTALNQLLLGDAEPDPIAALEASRSKLETACGPPYEVAR